MNAQVSGMHGAGMLPHILEEMLSPVVSRPSSFFVVSITG
jgi:hypothetical protein